MSTQDPQAAPAPDLACLDDIPGDWAPASEYERRERRATATMRELREFYGRVGSLVPAIASHLEASPIDRPLQPRELRLFRLALMYMEAAWAVEVVGAPEESGQVPRSRWHITPVLQRASWRTR